MGIGCSHDDRVGNWNLDSCGTTNRSPASRFARRYEQCQVELAMMLSERKGFLSRYLRDQSGNVESGLVLIPLLILVLSTLQISMGVLNRNLASHFTQSSVVKSSLSSVDGQAISDPSGSTFSPPLTMSGYGVTSDAPRFLSGGGEIYIGRRALRLPSLTPLLPNGDGFTSTGLSLGENR